jgi:rhodanese-related sulfurtransferase
MNIPLDELRRRVKEIPKDKNLILLCNTAVRSYEAQLTLRVMGITEPVSVKGGIETLNKCGLEL